MTLLFIKLRLEQVLELQREVISGGRFILLWTRHTVVVTLYRVETLTFGKFIHTVMTADHMSLMAKNVMCVGGFFQNLISPPVYLLETPPILKSQHRMRVGVNVWISFCLVYNKSCSCMAVLAPSYVFAHFCWLKSHFLLGKLFKKGLFPPLL